MKDALKRVMAAAIEADTERFRSTRAVFKHVLSCLSEEERRELAEASVFTILQNISMIDLLNFLDKMSADGGGD